MTVYIKVDFISHRYPCTGCVADGGSGHTLCSDLRSKFNGCVNPDMVFIPDTPEGIANYIALKLEKS